MRYSTDTMDDLRWWTILDGRLIPVIAGSQEDDNSGNESDVDDDIDDDDDDGQPGSKQQSPEDRIKQLVEESKRHRLRAKRYRTSAARNTEVMEAVAKHFGVGVEEVTAAKVGDLLKRGIDSDARTQEMERENAQMVAEIQRLREDAANRVVDDALRDAALDKGFNPKRISSILRLIDRDDIEVEDGKVEGASDAIAKFAEDYPEWLASNGKSADDDESGGVTPPAAKASGKQGRKGDLDMEYLRQKYPALRR